MAAGNLIVNGDAEDAYASNYHEVLKDLPGWETTGLFTAIDYAAGDKRKFGLTQDTANPGGHAYFAGGPGNGASSATQYVDLESYGAAIDKGNVHLSLSVDEGGYGKANDHMEVSFTFVAQDGTTVLQEFDFGSLTAAERNNQTSMIQGVGTGTVPVGTRFVIVTMAATPHKSHDGYNDGYADNLSLTLSGKGIIGGVVKVTSTHDYSHTNLGLVPGIEFRSAHGATATFSASQFGDTHGVGAANATIVGDGHKDAVVIHAIAGQELDAYGLKFSDWSANDKIVIDGSSGDDHIFADNEDDIITGGAGADLLGGNGGADTFVYKAVSDSTSVHFDTITDFSNEDTLDLSALHIHYNGGNGALVGGTLSQKHFDSDLAHAMKGFLVKKDAIFFQPNHGTYADQEFLIVNVNGKAGYQAGQDLVI